MSLVSRLQVLRAHAQMRADKREADLRSIQRANQNVLTRSLRHGSVPSDSQSPLEETMPG